MSTIQELHKSYIQQHRNGAKLGRSKVIYQVFSMIIRDESAKIIRMTKETFK
ncbi:hypothetical protein QCF77_gp62 [Escherichia phage vB_EcoS-Ro145c2YLVW]|uniref:hypothetical protein n=1 Tax=Escherichia phage vB_EcoS-Ro145c2YLVW TaxID=2144178 RepID=UPI0010194F2A|nr:hypothetical protein QCF77_gp62 [Escherichia phage vB_EcoS-Ro145c2YLVW]AUX83708.1 hypothetical protein vBEcoSRo145clw_00032 [Escherichia phage vB_EcoS-Ro145clw]AVZ45546.1 hypothetical protein Ro145c2YLVW_00062 [Escherichia phage vB_EcoS-Ro145c2YLVW]